ncbi:MAG: radical SAM protein [Nitrospirae bacterium]|nr:radical SAM protein [Nitrospirota bacterium]
MPYDIVVVWRVLEHCNLTCPFCEFRKNLSFSRTSFSTEEILRFSFLLAEYSRLTNKRILVSWLGGESLLWKGIFDVSRSLKSHGLLVSATTNGTLLGLPDIAEQVVRVFDEITISIDGFNSVHDQLRCQEGLFEKLLEAISRIDKLRATIPSALNTIRVNSILSSVSINDFEKLCRRLGSAGVNQITFNQLISDKKSELYASLGLRPEHLDSLAKIHQLGRPLFEELNVKLLGSDLYFARIQKYISDEPVSIANCYPGSRILFIDQFGRIGPCSFITAQTGIQTSDVHSINDFSLLPDRLRQSILTNHPSQCDNCLDPNVFGKFDNPSVLFNLSQSRISNGQCLVDAAGNCDDRSI